jgi:hypothetical protein
MLTKRDLVRSAVLVAMSAAATKSDARQRNHSPPRLGFALIFPAKIVTNYALGPGEVQLWTSFAIANTGSFPFDPSTVKISSQIGNNNLPGPARLVFSSESGSFILNPGELSGDTFGLSLAAVQSEIPQVTSVLPLDIRVIAYFFNAGAASFVNTSSNLNFTLTLTYAVHTFPATARFTTAYVTGTGAAPVYPPPMVATPGFAHSLSLVHGF